MVKVSASAEKHAGILWARQTKKKKDIRWRGSELAGEKHRWRRARDILGVGRAMWTSGMTVRSSHAVMTCTQPRLIIRPCTTKRASSKRTRCSRDRMPRWAVRSLMVIAPRTQTAAAPMLFWAASACGHQEPCNETCANLSRSHACMKQSDRTGKAYPHALPSRPRSRLTRSLPTWARSCLRPWLLSNT